MYPPFPFTGYTPVALVDDLGMLAVHAGNVDNQPSLTSSQRAQQHFHGPAPYLKDEVQRDTYGAPAEFLKDGGSDKADEQQIYNKRETAVFRRVMSRIAEKSASARKMFLSIDVNHEGELSYQALRDGLAKLGAPTTKEEFDLLTRKVDTDSLGKVTYAQFARAFKVCALEACVSVFVSLDCVLFPLD